MVVKKRFRCGCTVIDAAGSAAGRCPAHGDEVVSVLVAGSAAAKLRFGESLAIPANGLYYPNFLRVA